MPLRSPEFPLGAVQHPKRGFAFAMQDHSGRRVVVRIPIEVAQDFAPLSSPEENIVAYRTTFERIASDKFDRGEIAADGSVVVSCADLPRRPQS